MSSFPGTPKPLRAPPHDADSLVNIEGAGFGGGGEDGSHRGDVLFNRPSRRTVAIVAVVVIVVVASIGLVYTMPWSKIKVHLYNEEGSDVDVVIYIDGTERVRLVLPAEGEVLVCNVIAGLREVTVEGQNASLGAQGGVYRLTIPYEVGLLTTVDLHFYVEMG